MDPFDEAQLHLTAFVMAFVVPEKRDRWGELLSRRGRNTFRNSSKLMDALDKRYCVQVDGNWNLLPSRHGVFYDFCGEPEVKSLAEAIVLGNDTDAIFSLDPGHLAIHFSHEGWSWICQR